MTVLNAQLAEFLKVDLPVLLGPVGRRWHPRASAQGAVLPPGPVSVMYQGGHHRAPSLHPRGILLALMCVRACVWLQDGM